MSGNEMNEKQLDRVVEQVEQARAGFRCAICGNRLSAEQYTELVEEIHLLLQDVNIHAVYNQIPVAIPDGFAFAYTP